MTIEVESSARDSGFGRLARFVAVRFPPWVHGPVALLLAWSFEALTVSVGSHRSWSPGIGSVDRAVTVVLVLLFLRMVDEHKDLDYDRIHHPGRPLVTGAVRTTDLRTGRWITAGVVLLLNMYSPALCVAVLLVLGAGLLLWAVENTWPPARADIVVNLVLAVPIHLLLSGYLYLSLVLAGAVRADARVLVGLMVVFCALFMHVEFARKTRPGEYGERLYSDVLGPGLSATITVALAVLVSVVHASLTRPWQFQHSALAIALVPQLALILPLYGALRFRRTRSWPVATAVAFAVVCCLGFLTHAALPR